MVFSSVTFIFYFLPIVLAAYFLAGPKGRNFVLFFSGLVFYLWGAGEVVFLLIFLVLLDWIFAWLISRALLKQQERVKTLWVVLAVCANMGMLAYFKYANFFMAQVNQTGRWLWPGFSPLPDPGILLPIGISFFTFHGVSYVVDVANRRARALKNPVDFGMYMSMFPQLVAGPIVRFYQIAGQIRNRPVSWDQVFSGAVRFVHGLSKKVIIADSVCVLADQAFGVKTGLGAGAGWIGILAYSMQIYFDFSGYSDMAIGLGRMVGFELPENFRRPYSSVSITDFWQRWHITLTQWFRDYVFLPMSVGKKSEIRISANLMLIFLLVGFWHGANWTFILFGVYHGFWMVLERMTGQRLGRKVSFAWMWRIVTYLLVILSMVLFRAGDVGQAWAYYRSLLGFGHASGSPLWETGIPWQAVAALAAGLVTLFFPGTFVTGKYLETSDSKLAAGLRLGMTAGALTVCAVLVISRHFSPFIYFQF